MDPAEFRAWMAAFTIINRLADDRDAAAAVIVAARTSLAVHGDGWLRDALAAYDRPGQGG